MFILTSKVKPTSKLMQPSSRLVVDPSFASTVHTAKKSWSPLQTAGLLNYVDSEVQQAKSVSPPLRLCKLHAHARVIGTLGCDGGVLWVRWIKAATACYPQRVQVSTCPRRSAPQPVLSAWAQLLSVCFQVDLSLHEFRSQLEFRSQDERSYRSRLSSEVGVSFWVSKLTLTLVYSQLEFVKSACMGGDQCQNYTGVQSLN